jgi:hypothetical protein
MIYIRRFFVHLMRMFELIFDQAALINTMWFTFRHVSNTVVIYRAYTLMTRPHSRVLDPIIHRDYVYDLTASDCVQMKWFRFMIARYSIWHIDTLCIYNFGIHSGNSQSSGNGQQNGPAVSTYFYNDYQFVVPYCLSSVLSKRWYTATSSSERTRTFVPVVSCFVTRNGHSIFSRLCVAGKKFMDFCENIPSPHRNS